MNLSGHSTARVASWYFLEELRLLFDVGDGVAATLGSKCQKVDQVFISHADRDHIGGLMQLNHLAARRDRPLTYYYPKDSSSFPALRDFLERFDADVPKAEWVAVTAGDRVPVGRNLLVEVGENDHLAVGKSENAGLTKSLDYRVIEIRRHLKDAYQGVDGAEIGRIRAEHGDDAVTFAADYPLFGYSGDTPAFDPTRWRGTEVLVHEATFIAPDSGTRGHCELGNVVRGAAALGLKALVLGHFSNRYSRDEIHAAIAREAEAGAVPFPVYAFVPGETVRDLLSGLPVWAP